jgi:prophage antirepressor-like protein
MNEVTIFPFEKGKEVRALTRDGEPWFVAKDVCDILGIRNHRDVLAKTLDEDEADVDTIYVRSENGVEQKREMHIVNEPGLYRLIFQSRKANAKLFKRWVFHEVLPSIRKTGSYSAGTGVPEALLGDVVELAAEKLREGGMGWLQARRIPIVKFDLADGGRAYAFPSNGKKLSKNIEIYDNAGKCIRMGVAKDTKQYTLFATVEDLIGAANKIVSRTDVDIDDLLRWQADLRCQAAGLPGLPLPQNLALPKQIAATA